MRRKLSLLAIFGIAMGYLEGVVVVYLHEGLQVPSALPIAAVVKAMTERYLHIETGREVATIVMLAAVALLASASWRERAVAFLWAFAFWDLFYYVALYLLLRWPPTLTTMDVLFLIPVPWLAPVWVPLGISTATIVAIGVWERTHHREH